MVDLLVVVNKSVEMIKWGNAYASDATGTTELSSRDIKDC